VWSTSVDLGANFPKYEECYPAINIVTSTRS
jgi:hypothetical protein